MMTNDSKDQGREALSDDQWYDLASKHANSDWCGDGYLSAIKAVCADYSALATSASALARDEASVPEGWKLVPIEPTMEMLIAARRADREYQGRMGLPDYVGVGGYDHWCAMIDATDANAMNAAWNWKNGKENWGHEPTAKGLFEDGWNSAMKFWGISDGTDTSPAASSAATLKDDEPVAWATKSDGYVFYGYNKPDRVEEDLIPLYTASSISYLAAKLLAERAAASSAATVSDAASVGVGALSIMRQAFRVTEAHGDPDPGKHRFHMRFTFRSMDEMQAADKQWHVFLKAHQAPAAAGVQDELACKCRRLGDWNGDHHPLCDRAASSATAPLTSDSDAAVDAFLAEVRAELIRARAKFPGDRIMTIALAEEFGELCKAVLDECSANVRKEAVQTAVMCARVVLDGDGSVNDWRAERGLDSLVTAQSTNGEQS